VLSTNYDNCYAAAFHENFPERHLAVVGRGSEDCQRVLSSFSSPGRSLLWALQGYLSDVPHSGLRSTVTPDLESQLVVGHEEYRRVTYRDLHFRRAFAEVFRQRSLLFLGSGIQESYLQELFGEVLEFYGPSSRPHYAFLEKDQVDREFMLARFQIIVVEYPKGEPVVVEQRLERLAEEVRRPSRTPLSWSWGRVERRSEDKHDWRSVPDLEVIRGPLPNKHVEGECLAVSAGGSGEGFFLSPGIERVMNGWQVFPNRENPEIFQPYIGGYKGKDVFAVRARSNKDERSLAHIYDGSLALFRHLATYHRYRCIRMQLLATGGQDKHGVSAVRWKVGTYPERFSFIQTVRAWAAWRKENPKLDCRLALHVMLDSVYQDIANGRIDVLELLSCADIRFFVEVVSDNGELDRRPFQETPDVTLGSVVRNLQLTESLWTVRVSPPPVMPDGNEDETLQLSPQRLAQTLQMLGIVPGSTVHFSRVAGKK
jgi:hypothetical protein